MTALAIAPATLPVGTPISSPYYTAPVVVWTVGQKPPTTNWFIRDTERNPAYFLAWSYSCWGRKIVRAYAAIITGQTLGR